MSYEILQQKRRQLKEEIEVAKFHLSNNIENIQPSDYLPTSKELIPDFAYSLLSLPAKLLPQAEAVTKNFLPKNNIFRIILKMLRILIKK